MPWTDRSVSVISPVRLTSSATRLAGLVIARLVKMGRPKRTIEQLLADTCGACHRTFRTTQGLSAHQSMSQTCSWYKKGKLKEMFDFDGLQEAADSSVVVETVRCVA